MYKGALLIFLCLLLHARPGFSQKQGVKYTKITGENDIRIGKIASITQDKYGFRWFLDQTYKNLIKYDGSTMQRYSLEENNPHGFIGRIPECMTTDSTGAIWIGYFGEGLDRFDPALNTVTHYEYDSLNPSSLSNNTVNILLIDHLQNLWIGTGGGVNLFNPETDSFDRFTHDSTDNTSLSHNIVRSLYEDGSGTLWVGTGYEFNKENVGGLNRFNRETKSFTRYLHDPNDPNSLIDNRVRAIFEDSKGIFWVGTQGDGLHTMDRETGLFTRHSYDPRNPNKLSRPPFAAWYDAMTFILEDDEDQIWIGSNNSGVNRYDPVSNSIKHYGNNRDDFGTYIDNSSWAAYVAEDGHIWMSTQLLSLYKIDLHKSIIEHFPELANCFYEDPNSTFWIGMNEGLVRIDKHGSTRNFSHDPLDNNSLSGNAVEAITMDPNGILWVGTQSGLNRFDPLTEAFMRFEHDENDPSSLSNDNVTSILADGDSIIWIGTFGGGLEKLNTNTFEFNHYQSSENRGPKSLHSNWITSMAKDSNNNLWIGLSMATVDRFIPESGQFTHYNMGRVNSIHVDQEDNVWAGTTKGLSYYDPEIDSFRTIFSDSSVPSITSDNNNNIWMASSSGILRLEKSTNTINVFGKERGVEQLWFQNDGAYKRHNGQVYFGTVTGHYSFTPSEFVDVSRESKVHITGLWLNGEVVEASPNGPINEPILDANEINLGYDQNAFALGVNEIDYGDGENEIIYHFLENYDEDWRQLVAGDKAYYFNVDPGQYIFHVKAKKTTTMDNGLKVV